ncbi:MAG: PqqD family peptide modification chaperone [Gammaproteobacteria bacterium]
MSGIPESPQWYRVAALRPALAGTVQIREHQYRGERRYVAYDPVSHKTSRLTANGFFLIDAMDGKRTVQQLQDLAAERFHSSAPSQQDIVDLLMHLQGAGMLKGDSRLDSTAADRQAKSSAPPLWKQWLKNPMAIRVPLINPEPWLDRNQLLARLVFSRGVGVLWVLLVCLGLLLAGMNWGALTGNLFDRVFSAGNLVVLLVSYPFIKLVHELAHALAVKRWGGSVPECGITFLLLMPIPYVDASASTIFERRRHRMLVAAAGIMAEMLLACLALFVWLNVEPGLVRAVAFNVMLIGGVSTVLFNGNPLLKFDGYYVFADAVDIPDLWKRSSQYLKYLFQRFFAGDSAAASPVEFPGERPWLLGYAITSTIYRLVLMATIILFVAGKFFVIGIVLAGWVLSMQFVLPVVKGLRYLLADQKLIGHRFRAIGATGLVLLVLFCVLFLVPAPLRTQFQGVVLPPLNSEVRAGTDGFIVELVAQPNAPVQVGDILLRIEDPLLATEVAILEAEKMELVASYNATRGLDGIEATNLQEEIRAKEAALALARERQESLTVRSKVDGSFLINRPDDLARRFVRQGELLGYVLDVSRGTVKLAVTQADIGIIRAGVDSVAVRLTANPDQVLPGRISREVPAASTSLPSAVLGPKGGGPFLVDPGDEEGLRSLEPVFHLVVSLDQPVQRIGERAYVRFKHGAEPLGQQWYRRARQLFLRQFDV